MEFINKQLKRRSERNLDETKEISIETLQKFKDAINSAPTSINGQGASAIFIQDKEMINKLSEYNWNQQHIKQAPLVILFVGDMNRVKYAFEKNGNKDWTLNDSNFNELHLVGTVDATIKAQLVSDAATSLGMGTCYIGGVRTFAEKLIHDLDLPELVFPIVALTVGFIKTQEEIKPKLNSVFDEKYNNELMKREVDKYDETMKEYFSNRETNKKDNNWSLNTSKSYGYFFEKGIYSTQEELIKRKFKSKK